MTQEALKQSIAHWERNVAAQTIDDIKMGMDYCALCELYYRHDCKGCPVRAATGRPYCVGSPYESVYEAAWALEDKDPTEQRWATYRAAAQAELDFLKSLQETT